MLSPSSARPLRFRARALLALLVLPCAWGCGSRPPNVILITIDTLRADHCSLYGYARHTTPTMERLAVHGAVYEQAEAPASYTLGSVGSILTGELPWQHGANAHPAVLRNESETLAEALATRGYDTLAVVANPILKSEHGFAQGFRRFELRNMQRGPDGPPVMNAAAKTTDLALEELGQARSPFFLWIHYMDPHWWYTPPPPFDTRFGTPAQEWTDFVAGTLDGRVRIDDVYFHNPLPPTTRQSGLDLYDGEIAYADDQLGRFIGALDAKDLAQDTLIVVTSDHGESLGDHGITFCHGFFTYEDNLRVPLIVVPPGREKARSQRISEPISLMDLKELILRRTDRNRPEGVPAPLLAESEPLYDERRGNIPGRPRAYVVGEAGKWRSLREGALKLNMIPHAEVPELELYDLGRDPDEQRNLAASQPAEVRRLLERIRSVTPALSTDAGNGSQVP